MLGSPCEDDEVVLTPGRIAFAATPWRRDCLKAEFLKRMFNSSGFYVRFPSSVFPCCMMLHRNRVLRSPELQEEVPWSVSEALSELSGLWQREPAISSADVIICGSPKAKHCSTFAWANNRTETE